MTPSRKNIFDAYPHRVALVIAAVTFLLFAPARSYDYVDYDDGIYVYANKEVLKGFSASSLGYAFTSIAGGSWMPLTWLSHMLDVELFGTSPAGPHTTNILLHSASAALLFLFLLKTTRRTGLAAFVALVFALHPLRNESVAWVSERKDVLATFFLMLGLHAYQKYCAASSLKRSLLLFVCLLLGLMSKPMLVTFPFLLLLVDLWPLNRLGHDFASFRTRLWPCVREKLSLFALILLFCGATYWAQSETGAVNKDAVPPGQHAATVLGNYWFYVKTLFWPVELNALRPALETRPGEAIIIALALAGITGLAIWRTFRQPWFIVGWLWYLGALVPVVGIVQIGHITVAERYSYIPTIGLVIAVAAAGSWLGALKPRLKLPLLVSGALIVVTCAGVTRRDLPRWKDSIALFEASIRAHPHPVAYNNIGVCYLDRKQYDLSIAPFTRAIELDPRYVKAYLNRVTAYQKTGRIQEANADLAELVKIEPRNAEGYNSRADVLLDLGRYDEAIADFTAAIKLSPDSATTFNNRGSARLMKGDFAAALEDCRQAIVLKPDYANAYNNLGNICQRTGDLARALEYYGKAIELAPQDSLTYNNRAAVYYGLKQYEHAWADLRTCEALGGRPHAGLVQALIQATNPTRRP